MDDTRVWSFEDSLWRADRAHYAESLDEGYLAVVAAPPYILSGKGAADVLAKTPDWDEVNFSEQHVSRPQEGLIAIAYRVDARKEEEAYAARCSSVYRRVSHEHWTVVQHQQTPVLAD